VSSTRKPSTQTFIISPFHFHGVTTIEATKVTDRLSKRVFDHKKHQTIKILICFPSLNRKKLAKISELSSNTLDYAGKKIRKLKNAVLDSYNFQNVDFFQKNIFFETF